MDLSKASNSISHHLSSIFPENCQIFGWVGWVGLVGQLGWVGRVGQSDGSSGWVTCVGLAAWAPEGREGRSVGPKGPQLEVEARSILFRLVLQKICHKKSEFLIRLVIILILHLSGGFLCC